MTRVLFWFVSKNIVLLNVEDNFGNCWVPCLCSLVYVGCMLCYCVACCGIVVYVVVFCCMLLYVVECWGQFGNVGAILWDLARHVGEI